MLLIIVVDDFLFVFNIYKYINMVNNNNNNPIQFAFYFCKMSCTKRGLCPLTVSGPYVVSDWLESRWTGARPSDV